MTGVGAIVRLLMLAACLVPFTSTRQAVAFALISPVAPAPNSTPNSPLPAPVSEEEETERSPEVAAKEKTRKSAPAASRPSAVSSWRLHAHPSTPRTSPTRSPSPIDPFSNGLGCPFRC
jgi:hypothetical protein